jgi:Xaa-Pro aminopeptidase
MELITDLKAIRREIGLRLEESSLYPNLNLDAYKDVTPVLIKEGKRDYFLLVKEVETGNFTRGGSAEPVIRKHQVRTIYYSSYFTWDKLVRKRAEFPSDEAAALEKSFRVKTLSVHADMALDRFRRLSQKFDLTFVSPPKFPGRTWVYELSSRNVEAAFLKKRKSVNRWAWRAVGRDLKMSPKDGVLVKRYLNGRPFRAFQVLNQLMKGAGVASVLASSPINLQEMTGIPFDRIKSDLLSLYTGRKIYLLSPRPVMGMRGRKSFSTLREAVEALAGKGTLGVEEKNLDIGRSLALGLSRLKNASNMFRAWREVRSGQDLAAYILGSLGTKYAMEGALEWTANRMKDRKPVFEKEVQKAFYRLLKEYEKKEKTPLRLEPYFMVLHAGVRTPYPSLPGIFRLSAKMKSLKLDAGIVVKDRGLILACSDLARSITTDKKGEDLYRLMEKAMLEGAIPGGRQGRTGEDVYWAGMRPLLKEERRLRAWKLLPRGGSLKRDYNRDIGHTFGKQESTTLFFKKGENVQKLKEGMVSAIEYQWPYQGYALGIEDMFVVGPKYGINITR